MKKWTWLLLVFAALAALVGTPLAISNAHSLLSWQRGYSVEDSWLCYGWSDGSYRCTQHWHTAPDGSLVSDNPEWVANGLPASGHASVAAAKPAPNAPPKIAPTPKPRPPTPVPPTATPRPVPPTPAPTATAPTAPLVSGANTVNQPCHDTPSFATVGQWVTPNGCFALIYTPSQSQYSARSTFGYCNWWVEALHPKQPDILSGTEYTRDHSPRPGDAIYFDPNDQGASSDGHFAQVVANGPNGWILITEMNFAWRGGGFGKVDYRFVKVDSHTWFIHS